MLHVREAGRGRTVVLLHAFPLNGRMWQPQLDGLSAYGRLLAPDFPGFGRSPVAGGVPSLEEYATAVVALLDRLQVRDVVVVGLSMGGYVGFRMVEALGSRLAGLVLADTRANADTPEAARGRETLAAAVEREGVEAAVDQFLPKVLGETSRANKPGLVEEVRSIMMENSVAGVAGALRALGRRPDSTAMLAGIGCPVVCVVGAEDTLTPPDVARAMADAVPNGRLAVIPGAGHLANLEAAEAFNAAVVSLLAELGA